MAARNPPLFGGDMEPLDDVTTLQGQGKLFTVLLNEFVYITRSKLHV